MRLADFILRDMEPILAQWEAFAGTLLPAAGNLQSSGLRDHAQQILQAVVKDLQTSQTRQAQREKSMGRALASTSTSSLPSIGHCVQACCACGWTIARLAPLTWTT